MKQTIAIIRKELSNYFGSPMALIFLGVFLAITLFSFFWVDTFFSRGIADVRPLFRSMPLLMIFLVAALTMRQWSEEEQTGTLEILLTLPIRTSQLVFVKFLAVLTLIITALILTLFLPITVSILGNLDWGPVIGGYLAAILMAAAYVAIGLFISSRTNNQIVSLILTVLVCGILYMLGIRGFTEFFGDAVGDVLRAVSPISHFESIERGVIDLRDLVYYLSLAGIFLGLNVLSLDSKRWSKGNNTAEHRGNAILTATLIALNLVIINFWLYPFVQARFDMTELKEYSLSSTTHDLLSNVQEPLLIRGYFSEKTHPLLAPLVPQIRDTLKEYEVASNGMVVIEIVDPAKDPDKELEANQSYSIRPTPFQIAGKYESSVINSYFDILIRYGDQHEVLNFRDLIEVEPFRDGNIEVRLRNLEYDLTRAIKKVVYGFQSIDVLLASLPDSAKLTVYLTPDTLPEQLVEIPERITNVADKIEKDSNGKFTYSIINPNDPSSGVDTQKLFNDYGIQPYAVSLFSPDSYYMHMLLTIGDQSYTIFPSGELTEGDIRTSIESGLKRSSSGFLKVIGLWVPPQTPTQDMFGQPQQPLSSWRSITEQLRQDYEVRSLDLLNGQVPADIDMLLVIAPQQMTDNQRYAIDQYLMRGGAVVIATSNYKVAPDQMSGGLGLEPLIEGLNDMLASYGITIQDGLVMDKQNEPFPVTVTRDLGGLQVQEVQAINFPFFVDVRPDGMAEGNPIVAQIPAVTMNWASPLLVDETVNEEREVVELLKSSADSWIRTDTTLQPDFDLYPDVGFAIEGEQTSHILAIVMRGTFNSYFTGKEPPLQAVGEGEDPTAANTQSVGTIESSPDTTRLVVIASAEFVDDFVFDISTRLTRDRYLNSLQFLQNTVDWSVEDLDLLTIRSRGTASRVLRPMEQGEESYWEMLNYGLALATLLAIGGIWAVHRRAEEPMQLVRAEITEKLKINEGG